MIPAFVSPRTLPDGKVRKEGGVGGQGVGAYGGSPSASVHFFLLIPKLYFPLFWFEASNSVFFHDLQRSMHQNDADKCRNFPVHTAWVVVAFWAHFLQLSSIQIQLGINAHIRNHQSTTGICVWLLILCCLWICPKRTAGIIADLDDCVDLLALGVVWLCLGVQLICVWLGFWRVQCTPQCKPPRLAV